jgi:hypothetical protein
MRRLFRLNRVFPVIDMATSAVLNPIETNPTRGALRICSRFQLRPGIRAAGAGATRRRLRRGVGPSGTNRAGRTELASRLDFLWRGDTLVVTRIDHLARSIKDLQDIVYALKERGATL